MRHFCWRPTLRSGWKVVSGEDGDVLVVRAGRQYELISCNTMSQPLMETPALSQGMLIVRVENAIYALGRAQGREDGRLKLRLFSLRRLRCVFFPSRARVPATFPRSDIARRTPCNFGFRSRVPSNTSPRRCRKRSTHPATVPRP